MKKLFLLLTATMFTFGVWAGSEIFEYNGIKYQITSYEAPLTVEVAQNPDASGFIEIPANVEYNGNSYVVTAIGDEAFLNCRSLMGINLPASVLTIGEFAFQNCINLTSVGLGQVTDIAWAAFLECTNLTSIELPPTLKTIGSKAFGTSGLVSIEIPSSVSFIGWGTFAHCENLKSVIVSWDNPENVTYEGERKDFILFYETDISQTILYVPFGTESLYMTHDVWKDLQIEGYGEANNSMALLYGLTTDFGNFGNFYLGVFSYSLHVPRSVSTINLIATPFGEASVSGDGQKTLVMGENNFEIIVTSKDGSNQNTYTVTIIRRETDYILDVIDAIPRIGIYSYDLGNIQGINVRGTIEIIDEYRIKYQLTTGWHSDSSLPLSFDLSLNGRQSTVSTTIPVAANSIYEFTLYIRLNTNNIRFTTHMDGYGRPSYVTFEYDFHPCSIVASDGSNPFHTTTINMPWTITNASIIDVVYKGEGNLTSTNSPSENKAKVYSLGGDIVIENADTGNIASVYSLTGQLLKKVLITENISRVSLPNGIYIVKVGENAFKVRN